MDNDIPTRGRGEHTADPSVANESSCLPDPATSSSSLDDASIDRNRQCSDNSTQRHCRVKDVCKAFLNNLLAIDHTQIALVPGMRTAIIMILEWSLLGIGNSTSTAFQLGALYVGLSDPSGSTSRRFKSMGLTYLCVLLFGSLLPGLCYRSPAALLVTAFVVAFLTGLSPAVDPALYTAMKLGLALFAVNTGVNRSTDGYGGLGTSMLWVFYGATASLGAAMLPEIVGNRDAVRTELFKVYHGFGKSLRGWGPIWGTGSHLKVQPIPIVTLSISSTRKLIAEDEVEEKARGWLSGLVDRAECVRVGCLCLTNVYQMTGTINSQEGAHKMRDFFLAVSQACCQVSFALQFPWTVRYIPSLRHRVERAIQVVNDRGEALVSQHVKQSRVNGTACTAWLAPIVLLVQKEVQLVLETVLDGSTWPRYSSFSSIPKKVFVACAVPKPSKNWLLHGFALRLSIAFTIANIPEVAIEERLRAHWFPMTVALIMVPSPGGTFRNVAHRVIGTLLGLGFGSALAPLFSFSGVLILLLGLVTYATVVFLPANYAIFSFFITAWIFVTVVGAGAPQGITTFYRGMWTLAAGALVLVVMYIFPSKVPLRAVDEKLAAFVEAIVSYTKQVQKQSMRRRQRREEIDMKREENTAAVGDEEMEEVNVEKARMAVIKARVEVLKCINEALLTPSEGYRLDPHSLAPPLASDLISALVIPQVVSLVEDGSADGLLSDIDDDTFAELDRLVNRLSGQGDYSTVGQPPLDIRSGRGPFSNAIASAHHRLDEANID